MDDAIIRAHSVELAELKAKHNAELIRIRKLVGNELEKLRVYSGDPTVLRLVERASSRLN